MQKTKLVSMFRMESSLEELSRRPTRNYGSILVVVSGTDIS